MKSLKLFQRARDEASIQLNQNSTMSEEALLDKSMLCKDVNTMLKRIHVNASTWGDESICVLCALFIFCFENYRTFEEKFGDFKPIKTLFETLDTTDKVS